MPGIDQLSCENGPYAPGATVLLVKGYTNQSPEVLIFQKPPKQFEVILRYISLWHVWNNLQISALYNHKNIYLKGPFMLLVSILYILFE